MNKLFVLITLILLGQEGSAESTKQLCSAEKKNMRCMINLRSWEDGEMRFEGDDEVFFEIYKTDATCGDRPNGNHILTLKLANEVHTRVEVSWDWVDIGFFSQANYDDLEYELSRTVGFRRNTYSNSVSYRKANIYYRVLCDSPDHWDE